MIVGGHSVPPPASVAIVRVGHCSGVLVQPSIVLSSGHCLLGQVDQVVVGGLSIPVAGCQTYPGYQPPAADHDIGFCRLAIPAPVAGIRVDDGPPLMVGAAVALAGYGLQHAFAHGTGALQFVDAQVTRADADRIEVGDHDHTACRGDSGGPVLLDRHGALLVAGIIHGGAGAICASSTVAVPIQPHLAWLAKATTDIEDRPYGHRLDVPSQRTRLSSAEVRDKLAFVWQGDLSRCREPSRAGRGCGRGKEAHRARRTPTAERLNASRTGPPELAYPRTRGPGARSLAGVSRFPVGQAAGAVVTVGHVEDVPALERATCR
jgi:hypothetical protein